MSNQFVYKKKEFDVFLKNGYDNKLIFERKNYSIHHILNRVFWNILSKDIVNMLCNYVNIEYVIEYEIDYHIITFSQAETLEDYLDFNYNYSNKLNQSNPVISKTISNYNDIIHTKILDIDMNTIIGQTLHSYYLLFCGYQNKTIFRSNPQNETIFETDKQYKKYSNDVHVFNSDILTHDMWCCGAHVTHIIKDHDKFKTIILIFDIIHDVFDS